MTITRLPVTTSVDPEAAGGGDITNGALAKNALYAQYPNQKLYITQRPGVSVRERATDTEDVPAAGRGIIYWDAVNAYYIVNNDTVYKGGYSSPLGVTMSAGRDPVTMLEIGTYLVILDAENNEGWYIEDSADTTLVQITDTDFPGNIANVDMAGGGAVLNGTLYVMDTEGRVYGSELNDPTAWDALNVTGATREQDTGVYLTKHHDHIVTIGVKSIEFFYDAANAVGSPLERRSDISYRTGATDRKSVYNTGDHIYFFGAERTGTSGIFEINQFTLSKISNDTIDTYMAITRARTKFDFIIAGATVGDHRLVFITSIAPDSTTAWLPQYTLVYDASVKAYTQFETDIADVTAFSVVQTTERSSVDLREATLLFVSGDVGFFDLTFSRLDSYGAQAYIDDDYFEFQDDYIQDIGQDETSPIEFMFRLTETDFDMITNKFGHRLGLVGTTTSVAEDLSPIMISWSDDHYRTFSTERDLDTGLNRSLTRLGKFKRRAHQIRYTGQDILRIEALEMDLRASQYA